MITLSRCVARRRCFDARTVSGPTIAMVVNTTITFAFSVVLVLRRHGTTMKPRPDIDTAQLAADYHAGASLRTIGRRYGLSHVGVANRLQEAGICRRTPAARMQLRICTTCGSSFRPKTADQQRCASDCRRETHPPTCKHGHPLTPQNLTPRYGRIAPRCRQCMYLAQARYRARKGKPWEPKST